MNRQVTHVIWGEPRDTAHTHANAHEARMCQENFAAEEWEAYQDMLMERRAEQWFEERGVNTYAGSMEEARDRFFDSLTPREQRAADDKATAALEDVVYGTTR